MVSVELSRMEDFVSSEKRLFVVSKLDNIFFVDYFVEREDLSVINGGDCIF